MCEANSIAKIMYSSNSTYDPKYMATPPSAPPMAQAPPSYGATVIGIPVGFTAQHQPFQPPPPKANGPWSTGLCDCFDDVPNCCTTFWCPCITFGQVAEIVDKGSTSCGASGGIYALIAFVTGCPFIYSCFYRSKLRQQYGLHESPCADCLVHCCCESCALCQEYRELKNRGFDMSIGWHENMEKQYRIAAMAMAMVPPPVVDEGMRR